jgi:hypothetical protein
MIKTKQTWLPSGVIQHGLGNPRAKWNFRAAKINELNGGFSGKRRRMIPRWVPSLWWIPKSPWLFQYQNGWPWLGCFGGTPSLGNHHIYVLVGYVICAHNVYMYIYIYRYTHRLIHIHDSSLKVGGAPFFTPNLGCQIPASRRARSSKGHTMCVAQGEPVAASPTKYGLNGQNTRDGDGLSP